MNQKNNIRALWLGSSKMSAKQKAAFLAAVEAKIGVKAKDVSIEQMDTILTNINAYFEYLDEIGEAILKSAPLKEVVCNYDYFLTTLPVDMLQQIVPFLGRCQMLTPMQASVGHDSAKFLFEGWIRVIAVHIETEKF